MNTYIIASHKSWNRLLAKQLEERTGERFVLVNDPMQLNKENLLEISPRCIFFPHWSSRINQDIWQKYECIIFHMTDVPYGRGGSPLQNLIVRGHDTTMISAIRCIEEMDAGPCYLKRRLELYGSAGEIFHRASNIIEDMIVDIIQNKIEPTEQVGTVVHFQRRKPHESNLYELNTLDDIYDYIRMLDADGYPRAFLDAPHFKVEFEQAKLFDDHLEAKVFIKLKKRSLNNECND